MIGRSYTVQLFHPFFPRLSSRIERERVVGHRRRGGDPTTSGERRRRPGSRSGRFRRASVQRAFHERAHACSTFPSRALSLHVTTTSSISTRVTIVLARKDWRIPFPRGFRREWASHAEERKREVDRRLAPRRFLGCTVFTSYVTATRGGWQTRWSSVSTFFFFSFRMCARESCGFESVFEMLLQDVIGKRDCFWFRYFYRRVSKDCITFCHRNT